MTILCNPDPRAVPGPCAAIQLAKCHSLPALSPATVSPIETLPPELLIETFVHCATNDALAPLTLSSVSRYWREVATYSPRVWQLISLDDERRSISCSQHQARLWLMRSTPLPFDVELKVNSGDMILPLLSPMLPAIKRWRGFRMMGRREENTTLSTPSVTLEPLDQLTIFVHEAEQEEFEDDRSLPKVTFYPSFSPFAHHLAMNVWVSTLPRPQLLPPLRFTSISISECSIGIHTQPTPILNFLTACPELETFYFTGWTHDDEPIEKPIPVVSLLHLRILHLRSTCSARVILSSIHAPELRELYLAHLNVDFRLHVEHHEEGDSDDESGDFSQSPWSDHATGMGLRKLITRSNPPIRILEMDFSDMRTKDFKYLFDRLTSLEEFLIVASDMSDTVINLLRPYHGSRGEGPLRVRLPRLQNLELYNCQRLSGSAILDAITSRVNFTDKTTPDCTLTEVAIVACEAFTYRHAQMLSRELGGRLRLV